MSGGDPLLAEDDEPGDPDTDGDGLSDTEEDADGDGLVGPDRHIPIWPTPTTMG